MNVDEKKYTILYFLDYGKCFGGAANTLIQQAVLMKKAKHKVVFFFSDYFGREMQSEYKKICDNLEIEYEWAAYQIASHTEDIDISCIEKGFDSLKSKVQSYHPDILHSVQINPCVELISRELQIPHIMNIYPMIPEFFSIAYFNIFPHYHLCDSWYYAKQWKQYLHTDSECIRTIVSERTKRKRILDGSLLKFICVGAVYEEKNQLSVIRAFHKALMSGIQGKLTLCGYTDGKYGAECAQYIEENNLKSSIMMKGFCPDMRQEYLWNDILICGSKRESYPNAISEAMANGLAVISTPVGGVPEVIVDGKNGYLADDFSDDALFHKIVQMQKDIKSGKIESILQETETTFLENHSPQAAENKLIRYYGYVNEDYKVTCQNGKNDELIRISDFRNVFSSCMERFTRNKERFTEPDRVLQKLWYLYHIKDRLRKCCDEQKKFYIWGAGKIGIAVKEMLEIFLPEIWLEAFLDSKKTGVFLDLRIDNPKEILRRENIVIFVAAENGQRDIISCLRSADLMYNTDYFILSKRVW